MTETIQTLKTHLAAACKRLEEALAAEPTTLHRDAAIQRFEFTFELSWKLLQKLCQWNGAEAYGPRDSIRVAARLGIIDNPNAWLEFLDARNATTHLYKEDRTKKIYEEIRNFLPLVQSLIANVETL